MRMRHLIAAVVAPMIGVPLVIMPIVMTSLYARFAFERPWTFKDTVDQALTFSLFGVVVAWVVMLTAGLQMHRLLTFLRRDELWHYTFAGAVVGVAPFMVIDTLSLLTVQSTVFVSILGNDGMMRWPGMGLGAGAASAGAFWVLSVRRSKRRAGSAASPDFGQSMPLL